MPERELRRSTDRYRTVTDDTETFHSFSYGQHYDPGNIGFGPINAINEERLEPGAGYDDHRHEDTDIVTWVLDGVLAHEDSTGQRGRVRPGLAQRLSAGAGVTHAERNASETEPLRFVQMMLRSTHGDTPEYAQIDVPAGAGLHETVPVHAGARLLVARPGVKPLAIDAEHGALVHVTHGSVSIDDQELGPGDELRIIGAATVQVSGAAGSEALLWLLVG